MEQNESTAIWNKQMSELTVGDNLKIVVGITAIGALVPIVVGLGAAAAVSAVEKLKEKRKLKKFNKSAVQEGVLN